MEAFIVVPLGPVGRPGFLLSVGGSAGSLAISAAFGIGPRRIGAGTLSLLPSSGASTLLSEWLWHGWGGGS